VAVEPASTHWIVILGAAVGPGGRPSPAMRRRVAAALVAAGGAGGARFLPTGGVGRHPPAEAEVMRRLLIAAGVPPEHIAVEDTGTDTLSSLLACTRILRAVRAGRISVATDGYHAPRCRAVLWALGLHAAAASAPRGRAAYGTARWLRAVVHEAFALPWDVVLARARRGRALAPPTGARQRSVG
jgi:vancomycin permeability regulator SanA